MSKRTNINPPEPARKDPEATKGMPELFPPTPLFTGKFMHTTVIAIRIKDASALKMADKALGFLNEMRELGLIDEVVEDWTNTKIEI